MKRVSRFTYLFVVAVTALMSCLFLTACGSDDKSELEELEENLNDGLSVIRGVHQFDVSFSGDTSDWNLEISLYSVDMKSDPYPIYENDKLVEYNYPLNKSQWKNSEFRSYSVRTDNKGYTVNCGIYLTRKKNSTGKGSMGFQVTSTINGKKIYKKEYVLDAEKSSAYLVFTTAKVYVEDIE